MDGIHDLGGKQGFGHVERRAHEPVFAARWEAAVFAFMRASAATGALRNTDQFRHAIERIDPVAYLTHGYYGRWLGGVETLLVEAGALSAGEIHARFLQLGGDTTGRVAARPRLDPDPAGERATLPHSQRTVAAPPRFVPGDRVRCNAHGSAGHTRLPAYARGRVGKVVAHHGGWVYPDSNAHGRGEDPQHLYSVALDGWELWGEGAELGVVVHLDLFETYLEAAND
jgi:nitrile hydratase subunit beta